MAIISGGLTNLYASLDAYLTTQLVTDDGIIVAVRTHGTRRFVPPAVDPWVEAHYDFLGLQSRFMNRLAPRWNDTPLMAVERTGYLQLNLYQRARVFRQTYTLAVTRDLVMGAFPDGGTMDILDYGTATAPGTLAKEGAVLFDGCKEHVQDMGVQSGVVQHIIQVAIRYLEIESRDA